MARPVLAVLARPCGNATGQKVECLSCSQDEKLTDWGARVYELSDTPMSVRGECDECDAPNPCETV